MTVLGALRESIETFPEPAGRVALLSLAIAAVDSFVDDLARARLTDVDQLRAAGWSYQRIAQRSGLSKSRVAQLVRAATAGQSDATGS